MKVEWTDVNESYSFVQVGANKAQIVLIGDVWHAECPPLSLTEIAMPNLDRDQAKAECLAIILELLEQWTGEFGRAISG